MKYKFAGLDPVVIPKDKVRFKRQSLASVVSDGLATNGFTKYDHEVKLENIAAKVNVVRTKEPDKTDVGVACGALMQGVPVTVVLNDAAATEQAIKKRLDHIQAPVSIDEFKRGHAILMSKLPAAGYPVLATDREKMNEYFSTQAPSKVERLLSEMKKSQWEYSGDKKHVFAKNEALLKEHGSQPRVVQQGTDMYNMVTGPIVAQLASRMSEAFSLSNPLNTGNVVLFAPGVSSDKLWDIIGNYAGVPVESDMKNNDASQSKEFRKYEAMFYAKMGAPRWFVTEFAKNTSVDVWTRFGISAHVEGQRWSGESTTTTGNTYVSACVMMAALDRAGITESLNVHGGDDYLGIVKTERDADRLGGAIEISAKAVGMRAEVAPNKSRSAATFYRNRGVADVKTVYPVPMFGRVLSRISLRANMNQEISDRRYMAGKLLSAAYNHRHVHALRDLLIKTADLCSDDPWFTTEDKRKLRMDGDEIRSVANYAHNISSRALSDFLSEVYGIRIDDLITTYQDVMNSILEYLDGWSVFEGKKRGKTRKGYKPPLLGGYAIEQLVAQDCG